MSRQKTDAAKPKPVVACEPDEYVEKSMSVLKLPRHELFVQELAKGKSATEAYRLAGYEGEYGTLAAAASRLLKNVKIQARLSELQERSAALTELTIASLTQDLLRIAQKGEEMAEASGLSVARSAIMDAAKLNGLMADRKTDAGDVVPLAERLKFYERRDAIAASRSNVVELHKPDS